MDQEKIIEYVSGNISDESEKAKIRDWINHNSENKQSFIQLKNAFALSRKSRGATDTDQEYLKLKSQNLFREKVLIPELIKYAAVIFLTIGLTWVVQKNFHNHFFEKAQMNEVICPAGQISELILSDGTKVWLNAGSRILYPSFFSKQNRSVHLEGEAFFEVKKDKGNPFLVETDMVKIEVLGTSFNVDAYAENKFVKTTLVEGKVEIQDKTGGKIADMEPGQIAQYDITSQKIYLSEVDTRFYSSWKEGKMTFLNEPLDEITAKLERWYNVKFTFASEDIKTFRYSGTFLKYKPLEQILNIIKISSTINYSIKVNPEDKDEIILKKLTNDETCH